jgi:hypothetical protein
VEWLSIKQDILSCRDEELSVCKCESLWCRIYLDKFRYLMVGLCYKYPGIKEEELHIMFDNIKLVCESTIQVVLLCDFNFGGIDWDTLMTDSVREKFMDLTMDCFLEQNVHVPTRGDNILDLVFTSERNMIKDMRSAASLGDSDHCVLLWNLCYATERLKDEKEPC